MTHLNRRQLLRSAGTGLAALALSPLYAVAKDAAKDAPADGFKLPPLPYAYDALEPSIDKETMEIHHDKHHAAYVKKLNDALKDHPDFLKMDLIDVLKNVDKLPKDLQQNVINNGGGAFNHSLFWLWMAPKEKGGGADPTGELAKAIDATFDSVAKLKDKMSAAGVKQFGSGWAWLVLDKGKLDVVSTRQPEQPRPDRRHAAAGRGRVGTRLLPEVPPGPGQVPGGVVERGQLAVCRRPLRRGDQDEVRTGAS